MNFFRGILGKILFPVIVMTTILVALTVVVSMYTFSQFAEQVFDKDIHVFAECLNYDITLQRTIAADQVNSIAKSALMIAALKEQDQAKISDIITRFQSEQKCTFFTILDANANVIYRTNDPTKFGDSQTYLRSVREALVQQETRIYYESIYYESTLLSPVSIRAAVPVFDENGTVIGAVTGGFRLDSDAWVDHVQKLYGVECTVFAGEERVATTVKNPETGKRAIGTPLDNPKVHEVVFKKKETYFGECKVLGKPMKAFYKPLHNDGDDKVFGMLFIGIPRQMQIDAEHRSMPCGNLALTRIV